VAGLHVGRLDRLRSTVTVAEQVAQGAGGRVVTAAPKSAAGRRSFAVLAPLTAMLTEYLAARGLTGADADMLMFQAPGGGPLRYSNRPRRVWHPACVAPGLGEFVEGRERRQYVGLGFHDLRRGNATALVAEGVDLKTAQARLGNSNPRLTLGLYAPATELLIGRRPTAWGLGSSASRTRRAARHAGWTRDDRGTWSRGGRPPGL
jgi:hypothetical protein